MVSAVSARVTHVRAEEFSDIRTYGAPDVIRHVMAFGGDARGGAGQARWRRCSAAASGPRCGWSSRRWASTPNPRIETLQEVAVATAPIDSPIGVIEPGLVAASGSTGEALVDGVPVVTATVNWLMGEEHLDPDWSFGPEGERFEIEVTGDPT